MTSPPDAQSPSGDPFHAGVEMFRGAVINGVALITGNLRAIFTFLIARLLGKVALGTFSLAWATADLLSKLGTFGFDTSATALVARKAAAGDEASARAVFARSLAATLVLSVVIAVLGICGLRSLGPRFGQPPEVIRAISLMLLALPGIGLYRVSNALSRGRRIMHHDIYSHGIAETSGTLLAFLLAFALGHRTSAPVLGALFGTAVSGVVAFLLVRPCFRRADAGVAPPGLNAEMLRYSAPIAGYSLLNLLIMRMDVVLLGMFVGRAPGLTLERFGVFCAAVEVAGGMRKVRLAFDPIFMPVLATHNVAGDLGGMRQSIAQVSRWVLAIQLIFVGAMALSGGLMLSIFGPSFREGAIWVTLLAVAHGTSSFAGLAETVIMVQRPVLNLINSSITVALHLMWSLLLIPRYGATGAAVSMVLAYACQALLRYTELRYVFARSWPWEAIRRPSLAFAVALIPGIAARVLVDGLAGEIVAGLAFLAVYAHGLLTYGLEPGDRAVIRGMARGRPRAAPAAETA